MSVRMLSSRLFKHGRYFIQKYCARGIHTNILEPTKNRPIDFRRTFESRIALRNNGLFRFGQQARKLFVDNILNRCTVAYSAELRAQAIRKFLYGDSAPFFALIGVSLASGTGFLSKDDELEGICHEIRDAVSRFQSRINEENVSKRLNEDFSLDDLNVGPPLAKGCDAAVYAANFNNRARFQESNVESSTTDQGVSEVDQPLPFTDAVAESLPSDRSFDNFHVSSPLRNSLNIQSFSSRSRFGSISETINRMDEMASGDAGRSVRFERTVKINDPATFDSIPTTENNEATSVEDTDMSMSKYPLALKMMFNYGIKSNAMTILRAMYKETIPARSRYLISDEFQPIILPPHPNIVLMFGVFCAQIPDLQRSRELYPMALPPRIFPGGAGRNMSLFLLMKRYNASLREYMLHNNLDMRTKLLLLTQLFEAIAHLYRYGIAHRDLKSDNILIEVSGENNIPALVLSDFGCSLADKKNGFEVLYTSGDMDLGGNIALMAPEILTKEPGRGVKLNYSKSDLWACGAISYEIFGSTNPFYDQDNDTSVLRSYDYKETDLPELSTDIPFVVRKLVENILHRDPNKRLSPDVVANVMHIYLWGPTSWLKKDSSPCTVEILQWLLTLTTKILCEGRLCYMGALDTLGRRTHTEYLLISSFLVRARLDRIRMALDWMHAI